MPSEQREKFVAVVVSVLPEIPETIMKSWIDNPLRLHGVLSKALLPQSENDQKDEDGQKVFNVPTWKRITLGTIPYTIDEYCEKIKERGCHISDGDIEILKTVKLSFATEENTVELVRVLRTDFALKGELSLRDVHGEGKGNKLLLCSTEIILKLVLELCLEPTALFKGEWIQMAMEPIKDSKVSLVVLCIKRDDKGLCLYFDVANPDMLFGSHSNVPFIFIREK